jgi:hypothetical protein
MREISTLTKEGRGSIITATAVELCVFWRMPLSSSIMDFTEQRLPPHNRLRADNGALR